MNLNRYAELEIGADQLTKEEKEDGWHFCADWDFMLINKDWPEAESCTCRGNKNEE